ncbi:MAG: hypothetical protein ABSB33_14620, partial [Tepidisphaeraceae bacterium]
MLYIFAPGVETLTHTMVEHWDLLGWGRWLLLIGAVLLYVASRAGVDALSGGRTSPGRRAVGHWIPIAATALVAMVLQRADLAISIVFATSIGCLSLLVGSISILSPDSETPPAFRRLWPFALPAALLVLLVGFTGQFTFQHALVLLIEGAAILLAWKELSVPARPAERRQFRRPPAPRLRRRSTPSTPAGSRPLRSAAPAH